MLKFIRNQDGFSMVQVLMGFAMAGALALAMITMNQTQNKTARASNGKSEATMIANVMNEILRSGDSCATSIRNSHASPPGASSEFEFSQVIHAVKQPDGSFQFKKFYEVGKTYGGLVKVTSLRIRNHQPSDLTAGPKFVASFEITGDTVGGKNISRTFDYYSDSTPSMAQPSYNYSCSVSIPGMAIPRCRVCVQVSDQGCGKLAASQCSPWVSAPNVKYWSNWSGMYDPDCTRIGMECQ